MDISIYIDRVKPPICWLVAFIDLDDVNIQQHRHKSHNHN